MNYILGKKSLKELEGVHPKLVEIVQYSIQATTIDFSVHDGLRQSSEQKILYDQGASTLDGITKLSQHQIQNSGYGHAVDLVPYINGKLRWEWEPIFHIALIVQSVSEVLDTKIRWGGCWKIITNSGISPENMHNQYLQSKLKQNKTPFSDGPHFELIL